MIVVIRESGLTITELELELDDLDLQGHAPNAGFF